MYTGRPTILSGASHYFERGVPTTLSGASPLIYLDALYKQGRPASKRYTLIDMTGRLAFYTGRPIVNETPPPGFFEK